MAIRRKYKSDSEARDARNRQARDRYAADPQKFRDKAKSDSMKHSDRRKATIARWRSDNRETLLAAKRDYQNRTHKLRKYGLTADAYLAILDAQGHKCALCGRPLSEAAGVHIDHDHETGIVRGILDNCCNMGLGLFRDDPRLLERAAEYLRRHGRA